MQGVSSPKNCGLKLSNVCEIRHMCFALVNAMFCDPPGISAPVSLPFFLISTPGVSSLTPSHIPQCLREGFSRIDAEILQPSRGPGRQDSCDRPDSRNCNKRTEHKATNKENGKSFMMPKTARCIHPKNIYLRSGCRPPPLRFSKVWNWYTKSCK